MIEPFHIQSPPEVSTLRDEFAMAALPAWITSLATRRGEPGYDDASVNIEAARLANIAADAMLAERSKGNKS